MLRLVKIFCLATLVAPAPQYLEDTPEVKAAREEFQAAFDAAVAGEHAALAPVNNDVQAEQIPARYLDDLEDVAAAKAAFQAVFDDVAAGGLAAKQAPAPVHQVAETTVPTLLYNPLPFYPSTAPFYPSYRLPLPLYANHLPYYRFV